MLIFEIIEQVTTQRENGEQEVKDEVRFGAQQYTAMLLINHLGDILDLSCKAQTYKKQLVERILQILYHDLKILMKQWI